MNARLKTAIQHWSYVALGLAGVVSGVNATMLDLTLDSS
jgi:hypothetical protein